jgi:2-amino-4-hydroxy-6-hydroxymethyldihydropteridine diphosphokinase
MKAAIGLGTSLGARRRRLELTVRRMAHWEEVSVLACSRWYRTPPMRGGSARNPFLNGVVLVDASCSPEELLERCQQEELAAQRRRGGHWGDRTLDLDLLLVEGVVQNTSTLTLPHPGVLTRSFVRRPLLDVWPDAVHPVLERPIRQLAAPHLPQAWPVGGPARELFARAQAPTG